MTCGIYCLTNVINGKKYIGRSLNIEARSLAHFSPSRARMRAHLPLYADIIRFGRDCWEISVLFKTDKGKNALEILIAKEKELILHHKANEEKFGYNLSSGGIGNAGFKHNLETKMKISEKHKGKVISEETKKRMSDAKIGKLVSDKTRMKMSQAQKGRKQPASSIKIKETSLCKEFDSINAASRYFSISKFYISLCLEGVREGIDRCHPFKFERL